MKTVRLALLAALVSVTWIVPAVARAVDAKKPSQFVTLSSSSAPGPGSCGILMDRRLNPDDTVSVFTIPPKQVLVLTGAAWSSVTTPSVFTIYIDDDVLWLATSAQTSGSATLPNLVIKSGHVVCVQGALITAFTRLQGFLAKDH